MRRAGSGRWRACRAADRREHDQRARQRRAAELFAVRGAVTAKVFIEFLDRLTRSYRSQDLLICDNHSTHHAKEVKRWVAARPERIELHFLPSYSPELNPDEYLNQDLKRHMRQIHPRPVDKPG